MKALPPVARAVSSSPDAYVYLAESIRAWPDQAGPGRPDRRGRLAVAGVAQPLRRDRRSAPRDRLTRHILGGGPAPDQPLVLTDRRSPTAWPPRPPARLGAARPARLRARRGLRGGPRWPLTGSTGPPAGCCSSCSWSALRAVAYRMRRQQLGAHAPGGLGDDGDVGSARSVRGRSGRSSTMTFDYAGMARGAQDTSRLVQLGVLARRHRPSGAAVPADGARAREALARISTAVPERDPFGAASPADGPSGARRASRGDCCRVGGRAWPHSPSSWPFEVLCLVFARAPREWMLVLVVRRLRRAGPSWSFTGPWRRRAPALPRRVPSSAPRSPTADRPALPDQRLDVPEARLRRLGAGRTRTSSRSPSPGSGRAARAAGPGRARRRRSTGCAPAREGADRAVPAASI